MNKLIRGFWGLFWGFSSGKLFFLLFLQQSLGLLLLLHLQFLQLLHSLRLLFVQFLLLLGLVLLRRMLFEHYYLVVFDLQNLLEPRQNLLLFFLSDCLRPHAQDHFCRAHIHHNSVHLAGLFVTDDELDLQVLPHLVDELLFLHIDEEPPSSDVLLVLPKRLDSVLEEEEGGASGQLGRPSHVLVNTPEVLDCFEVPQDLQIVLEFLQLFVFRLLEEGDPKTEFLG